MNAFVRMGVAVGLEFSEEAVRAAFRVEAGRVHPDAGGDEGDFAAVQAAQEILLSPGRRLREWLGAMGAEVDLRGVIAPELMELFAEVAEVGAEAEAVAKAASGAQSALARGMAEIKAMAARERVGALLGKIGEEIAGRVGIFPQIEGEGDFQLGVRILRELVFLEKWRGTLRGVYGRLM